VAGKRTLIFRDFDDSLTARIKHEAKLRRMTVNQFWLHILEMTLNPPGKGIRCKHQATKARASNIEGRLTL
jgi:hypothetical protein